MGPNPSRVPIRATGAAPVAAPQNVAGTPVREPVRLSRPSQETEGLPKGEESQGGGRALTTVLGSLAVVLAVFFVFVWTTRRASPNGMASLPSEVVESLGRAPLAVRQQMQLIRLGNRLLLLSVTPQGAGNSG